MASFQAQAALTINARQQVLSSIRNVGRVLQGIIDPPSNANSGNLSQQQFDAASDLIDFIEDPAFLDSERGSVLLSEFSREVLGDLLRPRAHPDAEEAEFSDRMEISPSPECVPSGLLQEEFQSPGDTPPAKRSRADDTHGLTGPVVPSLVIPTISGNYSHTGGPSSAGPSTLPPALLSPAVSRSISGQTSTGSFHSSHDEGLVSSDPSGEKKKRKRRIVKKW